MFPAYGQDDFYIETADAMCNYLEKIKLEKGFISDEECRSIMQTSYNLNPEKWDSVLTVAQSNYQISNERFKMAYRHVLLQKCPIYLDLDERIPHNSLSSNNSTKHYSRILKLIIMFENKSVDSNFVKGLFGMEIWPRLEDDIRNLDSTISTLKNNTILTLLSGRLTKGTGVSVTWTNYRTNVDELNIEFIFDPNSYSPKISSYTILNEKELKEKFETIKLKRDQEIGAPPAPKVSNN